MENETLRAVFCPDKGADILELLHKPTDTELLFQAPAGLSPPQETASSPLETGAFRDLFPGGWFLMLPNGPVPCTHRGAPYGQHGEATFLTWSADVIEDRPERISVSFSTRLRRLPLAVERVVTLEPGGPLLLDETVINESPQPIEILWGHHPNFATPFIEPDCRLRLPPCRASVNGKIEEDAALAADQSGDWPILAGRQGVPIDLSLIPDGEVPPSRDFVHLDGFSEGWFEIVNQRRGVGFRLDWDAARFPVLGFWRLLGGGIDYPWYGRHRIIALEPLTGLAMTLPLLPGSSASTRLSASLFRPD